MDETIIVTAGGLTMPQRKDWARELFRNARCSQKEIAIKVGVSEQTMCAWVKDGHWEKERQSMLATKRMELISMYRQLELLNAENLRYLEDDDPKTKPDYDRAIKLVQSIRALETKTGIGEMIETGTAFIKFVIEQEFILGQEITRWFDLFIQSRLNES